MSIRIIMLGDIVGRPGRQAVAQLVPKLREKYEPDLILANAENASNGSGLSPEHYHKLCKAGLDGMTLGDHVFRRQQIAGVLNDQRNIIRPLNLPTGAAGRGWMKLSLAEVGRNKPDVYVITALGRVFMNVPVGDPFAAVEYVLKQLPGERPVVILEVHAEVTSEKMAMAWQFDGRVSAMLGTHTHVQTNDARILPQGTALMCDLGMCGGHDSILGRQVQPVMLYMTTAMHAPFEVAEGNPRINGAFIEINEESGRAQTIEPISLPADPRAAPFV